MILSSGGVSLCKLLDGVFVSFQEFQYANGQHAIIYLQDSIMKIDT